MALYQWSTTAASNATAGSINWAEGQAPSTVNDSARQLMADVATYMADPQFYNFGNTPTYVSTTSFTVTGDQTATYAAHRRIKCTVTAGTVYGTIASSSFSTVTTVNVTLDSGALDAGLSKVELGILTGTHNALPDNLVASSATTATTATTATNATNVTGTIASGVTATTQAAGDNSTKVATTAFLLNAFTGANQSLAASGYQKLPGGLIIQWGYAANPGASTNTTVTFPIAFPTAFTSGLAIGINLVGANPASVISTSTTGMVYDSAAGSSTKYATYWLAVGY